MSYKIYDLGKLCGAPYSESQLAIISGQKVILVDDDACHTVYQSLDKVVTKDGKTVQDILNSTPIREVPTIRVYLPYYGIKSRVMSNYEKLMASMKEIGLTPENEEKPTSWDSKVEVTLKVVIDLDTESHPGDIPDVSLKGIVTDNLANLFSQYQDGDLTQAISGIKVITAEPRY